MGELGFEVVRLGDLDLTNGIKTALSECLKSDISIFIKRPKSKSLWAIPKNHLQNIRAYENKIATLGTIPSWSSKPSSSLGDLMPQTPSLINMDNLLLQLSDADIRDLSDFKVADVNIIKDIYSKDKNTGFKRVGSVLAFPYPLKEFGSIGAGIYEHGPCWDESAVDSEYFNFTLCEGSKITIDELDDPLKHKSFIKIKVDDCYVSVESANQLTEYLVSDIPQGSPYFVPEKCRYCSLLNQLAILGQKLFKDESVSMPTNLTKYLESELPIEKKLAETAAFFINPKPTGKMINDHKYKVQFRHLIEIYKEYYFDGKLKKTKNIKHIKQRIYNTFETNYGYASEKCRYAVKLITPDGEK